MMQSPHDPEQVTYEIVEAALRRRGENPTPEEIRQTNPWLVGNLTKEESERQLRDGKPCWPQDLD